MGENVINRVDRIVDKNTPERGYVADFDGEPAIVQDTFVGTFCKLRQEDSLGELIAVDVRYTDASYDVMLLRDFREKNAGDYQCPECGSIRIVSFDILGGQLSCQDCGNEMGE